MVEPVLSAPAAAPAAAAPGAPVPGAVQPVAGAAAPAAAPVAGATSLMIPKADAPATEWDAFHRAVGRPDVATGYEYTPPAGMQPDNDLLGGMREAAYSAGLSKSQFTKMTAAYDKAIQGKMAASEADMNRAFEASEAALKAKWGQAYPGKMKALQTAVGKVFPPPVLDALEASGLAYSPEFIQGLEALVSAAGEDRLGTVGSPQGTTPAGAQKELDTLMLNPEWTKALYDKNHPNHAVVVHQRAELYESIAGGQKGMLTGYAADLAKAGKVQVRAGDDLMFVNRG